MSNGQQTLPESDLKLIETRLIKSGFECFNAVRLGPIEMENQTLSAVSNVSKSKKEIRVFLTYSTSTKEKTQPLFKLSCEYFGLFRAGDATPPEQLEAFAKLNAPSIVFPLLRASIATLTIAAGFPPLTLPVINFHKMGVKIELID